jgi:GT2 family glycosyltransferase
MREVLTEHGVGGAPEVTIVVPVFNAAATIAECVSSLLALRYPRDRYEVVVVDNGSTDATPGILDGFRDGIRILGETTRGASAARNRGIRNASGRLIAFTDADCAVEPDWLSVLLAPLRNLQVGVVGGRILSRVNANRIERFGEFILDQRRAIEQEDLPYVITANCASRREVLHEVGLFDETLLRGQDVDLAWRIHSLGYRLEYAPDAIVRHHNERTIWGLVHEGYVHGFHGRKVTGKHAALRPHAVQNRTNIRSRLIGDLRRFARGGNRTDGLLWLLFDTGKTAGQLAALAERR